MARGVIEDLDLLRNYAVTSDGVRPQARDWMAWTTKAFRECVDTGTIGMEVGGAFTDLGHRAVAIISNLPSARADTPKLNDSFAYWRMIYRDCQ